MQPDTINPGTSMMVNNIDEENLLLSHLQPHMRVLEFGLGVSTITIAEKVKEIVSVEYNKQFYDEAVGRMPGNVTLLFAPADKEPAPGMDGTYDEFCTYINAPARNLDDNGVLEQFDVVYIDGRARVECAKLAATTYLKPGGIIFIHDYKHPTEQYRRREYEVVEEFLTLEKHVFAMGMFRVKPQEIRQELQNGIHDSLAINHNSYVYHEPESMALQDTCWFNPYVIDEMNRFYDQHIKNHEITKHMEPVTRLLNCIDRENDHQLLDLGCGTAMLCDWTKGFEYHGADLPPVITGCSIRNYPWNFYKACDIERDDLSWIKRFDVIVVNGLIDVMHVPLVILYKILTHTKKYLLIHRQEITESGTTYSERRPSYGGHTWHSRIRREDFNKLVAERGFRIVSELPCGFANWENGGSSFLLVKIPI